MSIKTKEQLSTPFERLALAYVSRLLSDKDFQILSAALEDERFFVNSRTVTNPPPEGV